MSKEISRIVPGDEVSELFSIATFVLTIPWLISRAEALVVFPGMGEDWRVTMAKRWWSQENTPARFLIIAGHNHNEKTTKILTPEVLRRPPFNLEKLEGVLIEGEVSNTKEQTLQVLARVREFNLKSLALFTSPYHLPRAYLTLLKTFLKANSPKIAIIPAPVMISPNIEIPELRTSAWEAIAGEARRIKEYQAKGDVATLNELRGYLVWLWREFLQRK